MTIQVNPLTLALTLCNATPNLFGSILSVKRVKTFVNRQAEVDEKFGGSIYRRFTISGIAMTANYETAVNNARERNGLEANFESQGLPWGEFFKGGDFESKMILTHVMEGERNYYIRYRHTRNITGETLYLDAKGNVLDYEAIEPYFTKGERRSTKQKSDESNAMRQDLPIEESVKWRTIDISNIVSLAYGGERYQVIADITPIFPMPEAVGGVAAEIAEPKVEEDRDEEINA